MEVINTKITLKDFKQYKELKKKAEIWQKRIERLKLTNNRCVTDVVKGSSDKFPYGERHYTETGTEHNTLAIKRKESELAEMKAELASLRAKLTKYLKTVGDWEVRDTLKYYYIDGCRYCDIAYLLGLDGDGSTQMKKVKRHFAKVSVSSENE